MKKIFFTVALAIATFLTVCSCDTKETVVNIQDSPKAIRDFLSAHFGSEKISLVIKDGKEYEVRFQNGWEVEFDRRNQWEKIDCRQSNVPSSITALMPDGISAYIDSNFEEVYITEIVKDDAGYDISLNNGLDLEFSSSGKFKRIDD